MSGTPNQGNTPSPTPRRIIVGISGASGAAYGLRALELLGQVGVETHLVISRAAALAIRQELGLRPADVAARATVVHALHDVGASISSGSFRTGGMLIAPCSIRTLSEIVSGVTSTLLTRAADVVLKERRRLVLMVRETPLHLGHLRSLVAASEMGAIIMPPVPAFYAKPQTIDELIDNTVGRALELLEVDTPALQPWTGMPDA